MSIQERIQQSQWVPFLRCSDNIYFSPVIPNKKLQGAMSYLPHDVNPNDVLMLIDDTVFGSAKVGMCLTAKGLFYKASFEDEQAYLFEHIQKVEADLFMTHLCRVANFSRAVSPDLVKIVYQYMADEMNQKKASDLNNEQRQACKLLEIPPELLSEQTLQAAYRKKMADFHPDKYQAYLKEYSNLLNNRPSKLIRPELY